MTGTNGKTTTTQLVEKMLLGCGVKTVAAGNIGPAFSARVTQSKDLDVMTRGDQLISVGNDPAFSMRTSVWLGFAPDHLDRYHSMEEYYAAKIRIFENQTADDWAMVNFRDKFPD
ncbi:MAG: Mur ligase family protein [Nibricoccus sp.]